MLLATEKVTAWAEQTSEKWLRGENLDLVRKMHTDNGLGG